jgi:WD40 repeat protein
VSIPPPNQGLSYAPRHINPVRTRLVRELRHNSPLLSCRFDPTGRFVFAGAQDSTIQRWELATGQKTALAGHRSWVRGMAFLAGQRKLFSGDYAGRILQWQVDAAAPTAERTIEAHRGWVRMVAVSPDGRLLASCGNDNLVKLWNTADGALVRQLTGHTCHVYNIAFHPGGAFLVSADLRGNVKQWDLARGAETRSFDASVLYRYDTTFRADIGGIRSMAFNGTGSLLVCAGITDVTNAFAGIGKPAVCLFDWQTGRRLQVLRPQTNFQGTAWGVGFHPSGFLAGAGGGNGGALWFWRPAPGVSAPGVSEPGRIENPSYQAQSFHTLSLPNNARDLHLHPDGRRLAIAFFDGAVRIYDMMTLG